MSDVRLPAAPGFIGAPDAMARAMTQAQKICLKAQVQQTCLKAQKIYPKALVQKASLKSWHGRAR